MHFCAVGYNSSRQSRAAEPAFKFQIPTSENVGLWFQNDLVH